MFFWKEAIIAIGASLITYMVIARKKRQNTREFKGGIYQLVVVINRDLKMSTGKVISQFGHAIDGIHEILMDQQDLLEIWRETGSGKIVVKGTHEDIFNAYKKAKALGLLYYRVYDAGKTQIAPGSNTCIAIGPATKEELKDITGHLALY